MIKMITGFLPRQSKPISCPSVNHFPADSGFWRDPVKVLRRRENQNSRQKNKLIPLSGRERDGVRGHQQKDHFKSQNFPLIPAPPLRLSDYVSSELQKCLEPRDRRGPKRFLVDYLFPVATSELI